MGIIWENIKYASIHCWFTMMLEAISIIIIIIFIGFWILDKLPNGFNTGANILILGALLTVSALITWKLTDTDSCWIEGEEKNKLLAEYGVIN